MAHTKFCYSSRSLVCCNRMRILIAICARVATNRHQTLQVCVNNTQKSHSKAFHQPHTHTERQAIARVQIFKPPKNVQISPLWQQRPRRRQWYEQQQQKQPKMKLKKKRRKKNKERWYVGKSLSLSSCWSIIDLKVPSWSVHFVLFSLSLSLSPCFWSRFFSCCWCVLTTSVRDSVEELTKLTQKLGSEVAILYSNDW